MVDTRIVFENANQYLEGWGHESRQTLVRVAGQGRKAHWPIGSCALTPSSVIQAGG
jgi:hypothetical protein